MDELASLVTTAGGIVSARLLLQRREIDSALFIGPGGVARLRDCIQEHDAALAVFDHNGLKPAQVRNLEERLQCRVISRTEVILDIFARRARSGRQKFRWSWPS